MRDADETIYRPPNPDYLSEEESGASASAAPVRPIGPDNPPWGVAHAVITFVFSVAFLLIVPNLCVLPYLAVHYSGRSIITREMLLTDKTFVLIFLLGFFPVHILTFAVAWGVATRMGKFSLRNTLGWNWPPRFGAWKSISLGVLLLVLSIGLSTLIARFFGQPETEMERIIESSKAAALTTAFLAVATAPLVEETVYRGILYPAFQRTAGPMAAVMIVAGLFAGLHVLQYWPNIAAISTITLLSLVLTVVRARTGRLLPCFVIHFTFNAIQSLLILIGSYRTEIERGVTSHPGTILNLLVRLVG